MTFPNIVNTNVCVCDAMSKLGYSSGRPLRVARDGPRQQEGYVGQIPEEDLRADAGDAGTGQGAAACSGGGEE